MGSILTTGKINLQNFKNEFKSDDRKKFFIDKERRIIEFSHKEELDLKYLFELISGALLY